MTTSENTRFLAAFSRVVSITFSKKISEHALTKVADISKRKDSRKRTGSRKRGTFLIRKKPKRSFSLRERIAFPPINIRQIVRSRCIKLIVLAVSFQTYDEFMLQ